MSSRVGTWMQVVAQRHAHRLGAEERLELARALLSGSEQLELVRTLLEQDEHEHRYDGDDRGDGPDWQRQFFRLGVLGWLTSMMREHADDRREDVRLKAVARALRDTGTELDNARELLHQGQNLADPFCRTDTDTLWHLVARAQAEQVDADLQQRAHPHEQQQPCWTVSYDHDTGGFAATCEHTGQDEGEETVEGVAPTPTAAVDMVATWQGAASPITVDPDAAIAVYRDPVQAQPPHPQPRTLLHQHGPRYADMVAACHHTRAELQQLVSRDSERHERHEQLNDVVQKRAAALEAVHPHVDVPANVHLPGRPGHGLLLGQVRAAQWIPAHLLIGSEGSPQWGDFAGHREYVLPNIADGLLHSEQRVDQFLYRLLADTVCLSLLPGWAGPIYSRADNGSHRIHAARLLDLPYLAAEVTFQQLPTEFAVHSLPFAEGTFEAGVTLASGLCRRGVLEGELRDAEDLLGARLRCRYLPAPWLLQPPEVATEINAAYERIYPGALAQLGIPTEVGVDASRWRQWLSEAATPSARG